MSAAIARGRRIMADDPQDDRLKALERRIEAARQSRAPEEKKGENKYSGAELAWRMVIELTTGLAIGLGIGYGLDTLIGTMPLFLILFTGFGFAAGVKVMLRTAKSVQVDTPGDGSADEGK